MKKPEDRLFELASGQQGFFTTKQALAAGYAARVHSYHAGTGTWIRECRGIYRLARFPESPEAQYVLWSLWSRNRFEVPQGVFSYQTALSLHELSDINPAKLHLTVPVSFRRNAAPPVVLALHHDDVPARDIERRQGFCLTRPLRTIVDLVLEEAESSDHLRQALQQALARGLVTQAEIQRNPDRRRLEFLQKGGRS